MKQVFTGKVDDKGLLRIVNRPEFDSYVSQFAGKELVITVEKKKSKRSLSQNAYIHALFTIVKNELNAAGNNVTMEWVKQMFKFKFLLKEREITNPTTGEITYEPYLGETHLLSRSECADFTTQIIAWAAERGIELPLPNEQTRITYTAELDNDTNAIMIEGDA